MIFTLHAAALGHTTTYVQGEIDDTQHNTTRSFNSPGIDACPYLFSRLKLQFTYLKKPESNQSSCLHSLKTDLLRIAKLAL